jgi:hypothetical protein
VLPSSTGAVVGTIHLPSDCPSLPGPISPRRGASRSRKRTDSSPRLRASAIARSSRPCSAMACALGNVLLRREDVGSSRVRFDGLPSQGRRVEQILLGATGSFVR